MSYSPPPILAELEGAIGLAATLRLVEQCGGTREYVPRKTEAAEDRRLAGIIGADAVRQLAAIRGGEWLTVPRCAAQLRRKRDLEIVRRYVGGESTRALAREYRLTERTIWRIAGNAELDSNGGEDASAAEDEQLKFPWGC